MKTPAKKERVIRDPLHTMDRPSERKTDYWDRQQRWFGKGKNPTNPMNATGESATMVRVT